MKHHLFVLTVGIGLIGAAGALPTITARAQTTAEAAEYHSDHKHGERGDWSPSKHIEGHLAYLHAELGITQAQEPQWQAVAQVMRSQAKRMDEVIAKHRGEHDAPKSAIDRLQAEQAMMTAHAQATGELLAALKPLYASFSEQQKKAADELLGHHHHHGAMH